MSLAALATWPAVSGLLFMGAASGHRMPAPSVSSSLLEAEEALPARPAAAAALTPLLAATSASAFVPAARSAAKSASPLVPPEAALSSSLWAASKKVEVEEVLERMPEVQQKPPQARRRAWAESKKTKQVWPQINNPFAYDIDTAEGGSVQVDKKQAKKEVDEAGMPDATTLLKEIQAKIGCDFFQGDTWRKMNLPLVWASKLNPGSLKCYMAGEDQNPMFTGTGSLASKADVKVKFGLYKHKEPSTWRHIRMLGILNPTGIVPTIFEARTYPSAMFLLTESPGTLSVGNLIEQYLRHRPKSTDGEPIVPFEKSLPILVDLARVLQALEKKEIVHGDLTEWNLYIVDNQYHTVVEDLRSACLLSSKIPGMSAAGLRTRLVGSAFRHAPEMHDGIPTHSANNVWQMGLVVARMMLGDVVPVWADGHDDFTAHGRTNIRDMMRKRYDLRGTSGYQKMQEKHKDVIHLINGMLDKDPKERWTAQRVFEQATLLAEDRKIPYYSMRYPHQIPSEFETLKP